MTKNASALSNNQANHILWIDVYRVIAIIIIIAGHGHLWPSFMCFGVQLSCVQPFLLITALLSTKTDIHSTIAKALKIATPFAFWIGIYQIYNKPQLANIFDGEGIISSCLATLFYPITLAYPFWFLVALIPLCLLNPLLSKLKSWMAIILIIMLGIATYFYYGSPRYVSTPPNHDLALFTLATASYLIGIQIRKKWGVKKFSDWLTRNATVNMIITASLLTINFAISRFDLFLSLKLLMPISIFSLIPLSVFISVKLPQIAKAIALLAPAVFLSYVLHTMILTETKQYILPVIKGTASTIQAILVNLIPLLTVLFSYAVILLLKPFRKVTKYLTFY